MILKERVLRRRVFILRKDKKEKNKLFSLRRSEISIKGSSS